MVAKLINMVFGCWHGNFSFPITVRGEAKRNRPAAQLTGTYVACLDCGKEFPYDWKEMKVLTDGGKEARRVAALATKEAA
jgi:hypothetical protein